MTAIPRGGARSAPAILSAGFRPFFLAASLWAALAVPVWLAMFARGVALPIGLAPVVWHAHEMVYGFGAATVAGFLLTAVPNWTGRTPMQGAPLALLVLLWAAGRVGVLLAGVTGAAAATVADLSFPAVFLGVIGREIVGSRNWRNLPVVAALALLLAGNLLVHLEALGLTETADLGNRCGLATLLLLISLIGSRIIPSFTRNWLRRVRPEPPAPPPRERLDRAAWLLPAPAFAIWAFVPEGTVTPYALFLAGTAVAWRLSAWQGLRTRREPLLLILHIGYGWLAVGLLLLGVSGIDPLLPATAAVHALTAGAVGTMTLAVMTRASLGHAGRPLVAGPVTRMIYGLITLAAALRVLSPLVGDYAFVALLFSAIAWTGAFGLFAIIYGGVLVRPRVAGDTAAPI